MSQDTTMPPVEQEREAFISWLCRTHPIAFAKHDAECLWRFGHVAALAWQARAAIAAQAPQPETAEDSSVHQQAQQAQGVPPLLAALKEKIDEAIKVSDDVGRSRGSNCYAQNTRAVVKICELQEGIARDLAAIASPRPDHADHVPEIAARLRHVAELAGCSEAVPEQDATAVGAIFSVLGNIRRALEKQAQQAQGVPAGAIACMDTFRPVRLEFGVTMHRDVKPHESGWLRRQDVLDAMLAAAPQAEPQPEREPLTEDLMLAAQSAITCSYADHGRRSVNSLAWNRLMAAVAAVSRGIGTKGGE